MNQQNAVISLFPADFLPCRSAQIVSRIPYAIQWVLAPLTGLYIVSVYILTPVSQFVPTPPYPLVTISLFSISMTLFLLCKYVHLYHCPRFHFPQVVFFNMCFSLSNLLCLYLTISRPIHISAIGTVLFLFKAD